MEKSGTKAGIVTRLMLALALMLAAAAPAMAQEATVVPVPLFQPVADFGAAGPGNRPTAATLTRDEEAAFARAIRAMVAFPGYIYSGCHDRAHAAYMLLPAALRAKAMKIWVIAPGRYSAVLPGLIGLRGQGPGAPVTWGYHVALAYRGADGALHVFDPVLRPGELLTEQQWFDLMVLPRMSLWTLTRGDLYLFAYSHLNPTTGFAKIVWNGNAFNYDGGYYQDRAIPTNIARDAVGVDATAGRACPQLNAIASDPDALLAFLRQGAQAPAECRASLDKFNAEITRWSALLGQPGPA